MTYWTQDRCAELLTLRGMGLTFPEVADIMGLTPTTAMRQHKRLTEANVVGMPGVKRFNARGPYRGKTKRIPHLGKVS